MAGVLLAVECSYSERGMRGGETEDKEGAIRNLAHEIPFDLTVEILTRLPAKSLKRFECVSKQWLCTIRNQGFIASFSSVSQTRSRFLVALRIAENPVFLLSSAHKETEESTTSLATNLPTPGWRVNPISYTCLHTNLQMTLSGLPLDLAHCCCVHGLFAFLHPSHPGRFTICNPSTREIRTLPDIKASSGIREEIYMYLGYDPVRSEYKALCSMVLRGERFQKHRVLTLGGGNLSWRYIKGRKTPRYTVLTNGICIDGMVYYGGLIIREQEKKWRIFRFNVMGERIDSIGTYCYAITRGSLINYNGKLASVYPRDPLRSFDVWVLDDFEKRRWIHTVFWVHPLLIELSGKIQLNFLGMNKTNDIILGPVKLPPKHEPLYIYYDNKKGGKNFIRRVELEGFEEFECNHTSDEQCVCQLLFSLEHFESLVPL